MTHAIVFGTFVLRVCIVSVTFVHPNSANVSTTAWVLVKQSVGTGQSLAGIVQVRCVKWHPRRMPCQSLLNQKETNSLLQGFSVAGM